MVDLKSRSIRLTVVFKESLLDAEISETPCVTLVTVGSCLDFRSVSLTNLGELEIAPKDVLAMVDTSSLVDIPDHAERFNSLKLFARNYKIQTNRS